MSAISQQSLSLLSSTIYFKITCLILENPFQIFCYLSRMNKEDLQNYYDEMKARFHQEMENLKLIQEQVIAMIKGRTEAEKRVMEIPENERNGPEFERLRSRIKYFKDTQDELFFEEAEVSSKVHNLIKKIRIDLSNMNPKVQYNRTALSEIFTESNRNFNIEVKKLNEERRALQYESNDESSFSLQSEIEETPDLQNHENEADNVQSNRKGNIDVYENLEAKINQLETFKVPDSLINVILNDFNNIRATIDQDPDVYSAKTKAQRALKIAQNFIEKLDPNQRPNFEREIKITFPDQLLMPSPTSISVPRAARRKAPQEINQQTQIDNFVSNEAAIRNEIQRNVEGIQDLVNNLKADEEVLNNSRGRTQAAAG